MNNYKKFEFVKTLLLCLVTCGLYSFYMLGYITQANNNEAQRLGLQPIASFLKAFLLGIVTCSIYLIYWYYKFNQLQVQIAEKKGVKTEPSTDAIVLTIIQMVVPIYNYYVLCDNYNRAIDA